MKPSVLVNLCKFYCLGFPQGPKKSLIYRAVLMKLVRNQSCPPKPPAGFLPGRHQTRSVLTAGTQAANRTYSITGSSYPGAWILVGDNYSPGIRMQPREQPLVCPRGVGVWGDFLRGGGYSVFVFLLRVQASERRSLGEEIWIIESSR